MNLSFLPKYWPYFNYGAVVTLIIALCVVVLGSILGVLLAFAQRSRFRPLVWLAKTYVWIFRGTPMVVQIMIAFAMMHISAPNFRIGILTVDMTRLIPGIIIIGMNSGAYVSETVRAGINAVPKGQLEAAYSLGIRPKEAMRYVIMPQAFKHVIPPLGNEFISMTKETSLVSVIGFEELTRRGQLIIAKTYGSFEIWLTVAAIYLVMTLTIARLVSYLERRFATDDRN